MSLLAGFPERDSSDYWYAYETGMLIPEWPDEEIMAADGWRLILRNVLSYLDEGIRPDFSRCASLAVSSRFDLGFSPKFLPIPDCTEDAGKIIDIGFRKTAAMPLGRFALPVACLWANAALCHNGISPFLVDKDARTFLVASDGQMPGTLHWLIAEDRKNDFDYRPGLEFAPA